MNSINEKFTELFQINLQSKAELLCKMKNEKYTRCDGTKKLGGFISIVALPKKPVFFNS